MPPNPDHVAQVEAALRHRFFPLVPKEDQAGWTEDQHDSNRLSRSLAAYAIVGLSGIDDTAAAGCITDGGDDGGIDSAYFDRANGQLVLIQAKFKRNGAAPNQAETLKTINGVKALRDKRFAYFNQRFQDRIDEIEEALDTPGVGITVGLVHLGDQVGTHAGRDMADYAAEVNAVTNIITWEDFGLSQVHQWFVDQNAPGAVDINATLECWKCVTQPRKAIYGQITAASLAQLSTQHGKALFQRNIRHYLGSYGVNKAIADTVRNTPGELFYLNNGITMVAGEIVAAGAGEARCQFQFKKASIVNGAQTAGSMVTAAETGAISPDARLLITVIEIGPDDQLGIRITRARNHQNIVRGIDFAALDPTQERLRRELKAADYRYFYRPSAEARIRSQRSFTVEESALALACLTFPPITSREAHHRRTQGRPVRNGVDFVVAAKKEVSRLWDQAGDYYPQLFTDTLSGLHVCRFVQIFRTINNVLEGSEGSQPYGAYHRRMFFRHGRYFIAAFIAHRCRDLMGRSAHELNVDERAELSRQINEISEIIYAESESWHGEKGYLAIFRNLTDAQPLADSVLRRLATSPPAMNLTESLNPETAPGTTPEEEQGSDV